MFWPDFTWYSVIDLNYYPSNKAEYSNNKTRPTGLGVQGLADVFAMIGLQFDSHEAKVINRQISEVMYYSALKTSCEIAKINGSYEKFEGSPLSLGKFHFDLYSNNNYTSSNFGDLPTNETITSEMWDELRFNIIKNGV